MIPIDRRCFRSRKKRFKIEKRRPKPIRKTKQSSCISKRYGNTLTVARFEITKKGKSTIKPIVKLKKFAMVMEIGINSRGKIFCLANEVSTANESVASNRAFEKNNQGIIPERIKRVKFCVPTFKTLIKIKLMLAAKISGVIIAHHTPTIEPEYFT